MSDGQQPLRSVRYEVSNDMSEDDVIWTLHPPDGSAIQIETLSGLVINQKSLKIGDEITITFADRTGLPKNLWYLDSAPPGEDCVFFRRVPKIPDLTFSLLDCMMYNRTRSTTSGRYELPTDVEWLWTSDPNTGGVFSSDSLHSGAVIDNLSAIRCYTQFKNRSDVPLGNSNITTVFKKAHRDIIYLLSGRSDVDQPFPAEDAYAPDGASHFILDYGTYADDDSPIGMTYSDSPYFRYDIADTRPKICIKQTYTRPEKTWQPTQDAVRYVSHLNKLTAELLRRMRLSAGQVIVRGKDNPEVGTDVLTLNNTTMRYRVQTPSGVRETRYETRSSHDVIVDIINNMIMGHLDRYFMWNENNLSIERLSAHVQMSTNTNMTQNRCVVPEEYYNHEFSMPVQTGVVKETGLPIVTICGVSEISSCCYRSYDPHVVHVNDGANNFPPKYYGTYDPGAPGAYIAGRPCDFVPHTYALDLSTVGSGKYHPMDDVPATSISGIPLITAFAFSDSKTGRTSVLPTMFTNTLPQIVLGGNYNLTTINPNFCRGASRVATLDGGGNPPKVVVLMRTHNCLARGVIRLPVYDTRTYLNMIYHGMARDGIAVESLEMNSFGTESLRTLTGQDSQRTFVTPSGRFRNIHPEADLFNTSASETFPDNATYNLLPFGRFNDISTRLYILPENHRLHTTDDNISFSGSSLSRNSILFEHRQFGSLSTFMSNGSTSVVECFGAPLRLVLVNDNGVPIPRNDSMYIGVNSLRLMCREITLPYVPNVNPREFIGNMLDTVPEEAIAAERRENRRKFYYNKFVRPKSKRKRTGNDDNDSQ